ncbi:MAG: cell envelope integrity protein TolA [Burkholderiaceae bacterium]|nr:cell envelope integrity protein TolA [Burkholderiaceae bacterium]
MDSTLKRRDLLMPRRPDRMGRGAALAVLAHTLLIVALAFGVSWRSQEPAGVSAELWAATPQVAAPAAVEPTPKPAPKPEPPPPPPPKAAEPPPKPAPNEAQIAIEKEKAERARQEAERKELERKEQERKERERLERLEREKAEKLAAQKEREKELKRQKEEEQQLAKLREENLKRVLGEAGGTGAPSSTGTAAREAGPSASYAGRIKARIKPNIIVTDDIPGNPTATVDVRVGPDGTIISHRLLKSSGVGAWDEAVLRAIDKTGQLPRDVDGRVPPAMVIEFRPRE